MRTLPHLLLLSSLAFGCKSVPVPGDTDIPTAGDDCQVDADGDGVEACTDCDDGDAAVFPGAVERCNGSDDDCDGAPDPDEQDLACSACDAEGFWATTVGLSGDELRLELNALTAAHSCVSYQNERQWMFVNLDKDNGEVECVYTGRHTAVGSTEPDATDMNTEHTWPQSQGADSIPARCDVHHLYVSDADANSRRGSSPFGIVQSVIWEEGGSKLGDDATGGRVFEPRPVHKGNAARSILYFGMRYGYPVDPDYRAMLQSWSSADPVDPAELERSLAIRDRQGAANPFVVCPQLVERL